MSIHHEVSVHCDECSQWEYRNGKTAAQAKKEGWVSYIERGMRMHKCPECSGASSNYWRIY